MPSSTTKASASSSSSTCTRSRTSRSSQLGAPPPDERQRARADPQYKLDLTAPSRASRAPASSAPTARSAVLPVNESSQKCPDFSAPTLTDGVPRSFSRCWRRTRERARVLVGRRPHCKTAMPKPTTAQGPRRRMNVVSAARVTDDATQKRTAESAALRLVSRRWSTRTSRSPAATTSFRPPRSYHPPDGVIDSALDLGEIDIGRRSKRAGSSSSRRRASRPWFPALRPPPTPRLARSVCRLLVSLVPQLGIYTQPPHASPWVDNAAKLAALGCEHGPV